MPTKKQELKSLFTQYWSYLALYAACKLQIFDTLGQEPQSAEELALRHAWHKESLEHLLQFLLQEAFLEKNDSGKLQLSETGSLLQARRSDGLYYACLNWGEEHLLAWQNLSYSIETGQSAFEKHSGQGFFDYLQERPEKLENYQWAMYQYALDDYKELPSLLPEHKSIADVGGGYGAALTYLKQAYPKMPCILFELPEVLAKSPEAAFEKIGGSFFEPLPFQSEAILLTRVLHDWDNNRALQILKNCFAALPTGGWLYIIENCSEQLAEPLSLLSLNMLALCKSYERSSFEYRGLASEAGFAYQGQKKLNDLQSILIFSK